MDPIESAIGSGEWCLATDQNSNLCGDKLAGDSLPAISRRDAEVEPALPKAAVLLAEGIGMGLPPGRALPRNVVLGLPDGAARSWCVLPESRWRRGLPFGAFPGLHPPRHPELVCDELESAAADYRVIAFEARLTKKYLGRLFASAGRSPSFVVSDFKDIARSLRVGHVLLDKVLAMAMDICLRQDVAAAAQFSLGFLQQAARNSESLERQERSEIAALGR